MSRAEWFSTKAKVAVAVAVIRNRPPGMSGRQHAEALGRELRLQDEGSKKKAEELQQEVLRLRQEVLMAKATSAGTSSTQAADSSGMDDPSQDLFGSGSVGFSEELQPDCDSETPDVFQQNAEPPAASPPPPVPSGHREEDALCPHVQFLQSLCALHRVEGRGKGLEALWFGRDGDAGSVLADTVCRLLDSVVAACRDPSVLGSHNLVLKACQVAARAMDLYCSQRLPSAELMRRGEEPLRELSRMLLHSDQPGRAQHGSVLDAFPVARYHNSCRLFGVLEELLQRPEVASRVEVGSERAVFLSHVEQRVFLLSDEFPLFSIRMWRIGGLLGSLNRQDGPE
ncbi:meiosis-specific protein MEI4 isoform X2 [Archocentrus centrarchus]|uniref:meiosis-specific protein MEI4 isoform X2 n=1 Tax=Archocentrus centrarchus TaxID=63155 RepID=UPI0011EA4E57|nr:meiosis-specific protein MEI4 isoform X2 [Archocentrus centrarchus]